MLKLVFIILLTNRITTDTIIKNGIDIQLRIDTTHVNVFELGKVDLYTRLPYGDERIEITCEKTNCLEHGTLEATVNANPASKRDCQAYLGNGTHDESKCWIQKFDYTLYRNDMSGVYEFICRIKENPEDFVSYRIVKLFVDNHPRLRTGSKLHHHSSIIFYKMDSWPRLSCEAAQDVGPVKSADQIIGRFDRLEWFVYETSESLDIHSTRIFELVKNVYNFSSELVIPRHESSRFAPNIAYKCCTMKNDEFVNCQAVFYIY